MRSNWVKAVRWRQVAMGLGSWVPGLASRTRYQTGGTDSARYCYSVWLRHLSRARDIGIDIAKGHLVELGPGDSIGVGVAAFLSGVDQYTAVDMVPYAAAGPDTGLIEEIAELYVNRSPIPDDDEFPEVWPKLDSYRFPDGLPGPGAVTLRAELLRNLDAAGITFEYVAPWNSPDLRIDPADTVLSQAVMEHVDDLPEMYRRIGAMLAPGGIGSHTIDFRAHATSDLWYGHLAYPDLVWRITRGRRDFLLNRESISTHLGLMEGNGLEVLDLQVDRSQIDESIPLNPRFAKWSADDLTARIAYVGAIRRARR